MGDGECKVNCDLDDLDDDEGIRNKALLEKVT